MAFSVRGRVAAIPDRVLDARLIACLLQPIGCARLNDMCVHDGTMGQMLPSTRFGVMYQMSGVTLANAHSP